MTKRARERGFTIPEALIATAIFAASIGALFAVYANAVNVSERTRQRAIARLHLESLLSEVGIVHPLKQGDLDGDYGDNYSWALSIEPYGHHAGRSEFSVAAWKVTASVNWRGRGGAQSLSVTTLRLGGSGGS